MVDEAMDAPLPPWEDMDPAPAQPPEEWLALPHDFSDSGEPPPQLVRTVNLLAAPAHDLRGPEDVDALAAFLVARAKQGIGDLFAHADYNRCSGKGEDWARSIAEHQTGIPYTMPAYFYGSQQDVAKAIAQKGRYPIVGQCQQSVTTALCLGGWDGGALGDIGSGLDSQAAAARIGRGWSPASLALEAWPEDLWQEVTVGSCLFWSAPCSCGKSPHAAGCKGIGSGHVAMVIRKHPTERKWQLWDTTTSFQDPAPHAAAAKGARVLWESHWWSWIPKTMSKDWEFRGIARIDRLGAPRSGLAPRGRCRLILRRRGDGQLLFRSAWMSMEKEHLPISWLLRSVRGAPFCDRIEAMWCVNSARDTPGRNDNSPLLDVLCDAKGNASLSWKPDQGMHARSRATDWWTAAPFPSSPKTEAPAALPAAPPAAAPLAAAAQVGAPERSAVPAAAAAALRSELLKGQPRFQQIVAGSAPALRQGASGPPVKALQEALVRAGFAITGGADGVFGMGTVDAVKALQAQSKLGADGVVGAGTLRALDAKLGGASTQ